MLPFFFRHYDDLVSRYVIFDDGSTDDTLSILKKRRDVEVRTLPRIENVNSYVLAAQKIHDSCWKESVGSAEWVIITAVDEFLYAPRLTECLELWTKEGVTAVPALGYQMLSPIRPRSDKKLTDLIKRGAPNVKMNKLSLFNPNKIRETNQGLGRHDAAPCGEVRYPDIDVLLNLHYKFISFEDTFARNKRLQEKLGSVDKENGWGIQYSWTRERLKQRWDGYEDRAVENVFSPAYNANLQHSEMSERWWRLSGSLASDARQNR